MLDADEKGIGHHHGLDRGGPVSCEGGYLKLTVGHQ